MATKKPCPGCLDDRYNKGRKAGDLCRECKQKLVFANKVLAQEKRKKEEKVFLYDVPTVSRAIKLNAPLFGEAEDKLKECLLAVVRELSEIVSPDLPMPPADPFYNYSLFKRNYSFDFRDDQVAFTEKRATLFRNLMIEIEQSIKSAFQDGERNGQAFVTQLATGQISMERLNEKMGKSL